MFIFGILAKRQITLLAKITRVYQRRSITITITGDSARIVDEGSLNGTWVNGAVVDQAPLSSGSTLQIGTFEMVFQRKPL